LLQLFRNFNLKMYSQVDHLYRYPCLFNLIIIDSSVTHSLHFVTCIYICITGDHEGLRGSVCRFHRACLTIQVPFISMCSYGIKHASVAISGRWLGWVVVRAEPGGKVIQIYRLLNSTSVLSQERTLVSERTVVTYPLFITKHYYIRLSSNLHDGAEPFFRNRPLCSYSRISQHFMEPEDS
jgi:hypothetical protein